MPSPALSASTALRLRPFHGVRYDVRRIGDISATVCPPYDDIGPTRIRNLRSRPHHIARLLHGDDPQRSSAHLDQWLRSGVLVQDPEPALYIYRQHTGTGGNAHVLQQGVIGALDLPLPGDSTVLPHEDVQPHVVTARARLMEGLRTQPEPLLLTYNSSDQKAELAIDRVTAAPPVAAARTGAITHLLWACTDPADQAAITAGLARNQALITDGHHRYAACLQLRDSHGNGGPGPNPWQSCLALLVNSSTYPLRLTAIHRVIPELEPDKAVAAAADVAHVQPLPEGSRPPRSGELVVCGGGRAWSVTGPHSSALNEALAGMPKEWHVLPAAVADHLLLDRAWSVQDLPGAVRYVHNADEASATVAGPGSGTAVLLPAMTEASVRELAGAAVLLPRKSTSFGPKPATGMVLRVLERSS